MFELLISLVVQECPEQLEYLNWNEGGQDTVNPSAAFYPAGQASSCLQQHLPSIALWHSTAQHGAQHIMGQHSTAWSHTAYHGAA